MALTFDETERLQSLLAGLPWSAPMPGLAGNLAQHLSSLDVTAGHVFFTPDTPVGALYLLIDGAVTQTIGSGGQPWYQKDLAPGDFFGQRSLVSGKHQTRAVAKSSSTVYQMGSADLSALLDRYPALREVLWKESLASRLRSIPLFEKLSDNEINWLAELVRESTVSAGAEVPIYATPGLWIVDKGQVSVAGPVANLKSLQGAGTGTLPGNEPEWTITGGNFFFTLQQGARFGGACSASRAQAVRDTHFFFLSDRHFNRMLATFPGVRSMIDAPLDIPACLANVPLFCGPGMDPEHRQHLAQICAWEFVPANQNISTQGAVGYSFVLLLKGSALVSAVDDKGHLRPVHLLQPGESYGKTSLLDSTRRDATVRAKPGDAQPGQDALPGAEILNLDRRDLQVAFAERPDLWHPGVELFDHYRTITEERPKYDWLDEGEDVVWTDRGHAWWLAAPIGAEVLGLLALLAGIDALLLLLQSSGRAIVLADIWLLVFLALPVIGYTIWNYRDDYYAVTNRRVTRHDREPFASEARTEAPLEMVQDVTHSSNLYGRIFGFGDVTIRTAAKVGSIVFAHVPDPNGVVERINSAKAGAAVAARGSTKEALRRGLMSDLRLALTVPDLDTLRALGDNVWPQVTPSPWQRVQRIFSPQRKPVALPPRKLNVPGWVRRLLSPLPQSWQMLLVGPPPRQRVLSGEVVWHKHWVNLVQRAGAAALSFALVVVLGILLLTVGRRILGLGFWVIFLPWLVVLGAVGFWLWYKYTDWINDLYIVTDERIIDVEKRPLALSSTQRESSLEVIQTVFSKQSTVWAKMLNYGDVVIRTAAADEGFTFAMVPGPMLVQRTIFQKLDAYRRRQESRRIDDRRRDVVEGLQVYHELRQDTQRDRF